MFLSFPSVPPLPVSLNTGSQGAKVAGSCPGSVLTSYTNRTSWRGGHGEAVCSLFQVPRGPGTGCRAGGGGGPAVRSQHRHTSPTGVLALVKATASGDIWNFCLSVPRTRLQGHVTKHPNRHLRSKAMLFLNMPFNMLLTIAVFNLHWWSIGCRWLRKRKWHQSFYFYIQQNAFSYNSCVYIEVTGKIFQTWTSFLFCKGNNNSLIVHL